MGIGATYLAIIATRYLNIIQIIVSAVLVVVIGRAKAKR